MKNAKIMQVKVTGEGIEAFNQPVEQWEDIEHCVLDLTDAVCLEYINAYHKQKVTNAARVKAQEGIRAKQKFIMAAIKSAGSDPVKLASLGDVIKKIQEG